MIETFELRTAKFAMLFDARMGASLLIDGNVTVADPTTALSPFFERVHEAVLAADSREIRIDLRRLEFITSSCIRPLVDWVWKVRDLPVQRQYLLRFLHDPSRPWQLRFLKAQSYFAPELITLHAGPDPWSPSADVMV